MDLKELREDTIIREWFAIRSVKESTRQKYIEAMLLFIQMTGKKPKELIEEAEAEFRTGKLMRERQVRNYILQFKMQQMDRVERKELAEATAALRLSVVKSFYRSFDIPIPRNISNGESLPRPENMNLRFNREDIRKMLMHSKSLRDRAIILTMKSSGMARNEIKNIKYKEFREGYDRETKVATIFMRRVKVSFDFVTFIDPEGTEAIIEYLKRAGRITKDGFFESKYDSLPLFTTPDNKRIANNTFGHVFRNLSLKMQLWEHTKKGECIRFNPLRSHNLRKFFRTALLHDGMDDSIVNYFMAHKPSKVSRAYFLPDFEKLKEMYMQHMHALSVMSVVSDTDLLKKNNELETKVRKLESKKEDTPEKAFGDLLEDEQFVKQLYEKFKALAER